LGRSFAVTQAQFDTRGYTPARDRAGRKRRLAYPIGKPDTARDAHFWSARHEIITAALWLLGVVALALLAANAHHYAEFPGDRGSATFIQQFRSSPVAPSSTSPATPTGRAPPASSLSSLSCCSRLPDASGPPSAAPSPALTPTRSTSL
jgi:hypothetical protein